MYAAIKQPSTSISHAQQAPTYIQQAATSVLSAPATASSHRKHPQQAATASSHINQSHQTSSCQLPASMLLPAASKQSAKHPHQAATHSKQQAATSFLSAPASSHISISYHQAVCYQKLASKHPQIKQAAASKQSAKHPHQAATHSKQQAATSFLSAPASSHISISYHQSVCYQKLASKHPHQASSSQQAISQTSTSSSHAQQAASSHISPVSPSKQPYIN